MGGRLRRLVSAYTPLNPASGDQEHVFGLVVKSDIEMVLISAVSCFRVS